MSYAGFACRAYNTYAADLVREYADRMAPVASIPMHTPQEAVDELEYAVKTLGFKAVTFQGSIRRPIARVQREHPEVADLVARLELFALDSDYDYDAVWAKCVELNVPGALPQHGAGHGNGLHLQLQLQSHRPAGRLPHGGLQGALPRRRDAEVS